MMHTSAIVPIFFDHPVVAIHSVLLQHNGHLDVEIEHSMKENSPLTFSSKSRCSWIGVVPEGNLGDEIEYSTTVFCNFVTLRNYRLSYIYILYAHRYRYSR